MTTLEWQIYLRASKVESAERIMSRFFRALDLPPATSDLQRYEKVEGLYFAQGSCDFLDDSPADAIFALLVRASGVAPRWNVGSPGLYEGDRWDFDLSATADAGPGMRVSGLEMVTLTLRGQAPT